MRFALYASILKGVATMIENFKFWCQRVLPTVFDDTLSYYECLCKLTQKLNETINQSNETAEAMQQLKSYVDDYFTNLNIQTQINNKLDQMAADGTLDEIINQQIFNGLNTKINTLETKVNSFTEPKMQVHVIKLNRYGDSIYIKITTEDGSIKHCLIDGGWNTDSSYPFVPDVTDPVPAQQSDGLVTYNYLVSQGVTHLDYWFVTHYHYDHIGVFGYLRNNNLLSATSVVYLPHAVNWALMPTIPNNVKTFEETLKLLLARIGCTVIETSNLNINIGAVNVTSANDSDVYFQSYYTQADSFTDKSDFYNNFSTAYRFTINGFTFLDSADMERMAQLANKLTIGKADVLKTPHHAFDVTGSSYFFEEVNPKTAVTTNVPYRSASYNSGYYSVYYQFYKIPWALSGYKTAIYNFTNYGIEENNERERYASPLINGTLTNNTNLSFAQSSSPVPVGFNQLTQNYPPDTPCFSLENGILTCQDPGTYSFISTVRIVPANPATESSWYFNLRASTDSFQRCVYAGNVYTQLAFTGHFQAGEQIYLRLECDTQPGTIQTTPKSYIRFVKLT